MQFYSTNNHNYKVSLKEAVIRGLAPDKGLYMPGSIPVMDSEFIDGIKNLDFATLSFRLALKLFGDEIIPEDLEKITREALNFETPLINIHKNIFSLELFHGPTLAFKDVGARYMARLLAYFTRDIDQKTHVLVATSGDTGSAVANGFLDVEKIDVHILYPSGLVSYLQEKQFTTLGRNITALEVKGNFDDCQRLVKEAFLDREVNSRIRLTSANSINIARLLPQSFYYFNAYRQVPDPGKPIVIAVPSGNFGNLTAGLIAGRMGLPVKHFIAATNINDVVPEYLETGAFLPRPSLPTIANAMDVGNPSNFSRILDLYEHSHQRITQQLSGFAYTDQQIRDAIRQVHSQTGYILDPHGATAYMALIEYMKTDPSITGIFPETAHPAKFEDIVEDSIGKAIDIPERLSKFSKAEKKSILISRDYPGFKDYLMNLGRS